MANPPMMQSVLWLLFAWACAWRVARVAGAADVFVVTVDGQFLALVDPAAAARTRVLRPLSASTEHRNVLWRDNALWTVRNAVPNLHLVGVAACGARGAAPDNPQARAAQTLALCAPWRADVAPWAAGVDFAAACEGCAAQPALVRFTATRASVTHVSTSPPLYSAMDCAFAPADDAHMWVVEQNRLHRVALASGAVTHSTLLDSAKFVAGTNEVMAVFFNSSGALHVIDYVDKARGAALYACADPLAGANTPCSLVQELPSEWAFVHGGTAIPYADVPACVGLPPLTAPASTPLLNSSNVAAVSATPAAPGLVFGPAANASGTPWLYIGIGAGAFLLVTALFVACTVNYMRASKAEKQVVVADNDAPPSGITSAESSGSIAFTQGYIAPQSRGRSTLNHQEFDPSKDMSQSPAESYADITNNKKGYVDMRTSDAFDNDDGSYTPLTLKPADEKPAY